MKIMSSPPIMENVPKTRNTLSKVNIVTSFYVDTLYKYGYALHVKLMKGECKKDMKMKYIYNM